MAPMTCSNCGKPNDGGFCSSCGHANAALAASPLRPCLGCGRQVDMTAVACPGCGRPKPTTPKPSVLKGLLSLAASIAVVGFVCSKLGSSDSTSSSPPPAFASSTPSAPREQTKAIEVTAVQLYKDYAENEVSADAQYKGKLLQIDGYVDSIDKDMFDNVTLHLRTGNAFSRVMATLQSSQASAAGELKKRQRVELLCKGGTRIIGSPTGDGCVISATWK